MKKFLCALLALIMVLSLAACGSGSTEPASTAPASTAEPAPADETSEGKVFHIYAWNEEFKGFFEKYYKVPEGIEVVWTIVPNEGTQYQDALDLALLNQESASDDDKVDMFLAEADYILKYTNSEYTQDIKALGVTNFSNTYKYTVEAASDANGVVKGVSFQCCPAGMIYRRSIALDVLGTDDPAEVQAAVADWAKYNEVAEKVHAKGYLMTASYAEDYRVFSNNTSSPWVDASGNVQIDPAIQAWMDQAEKFVNNGYTLTSGVWDAETTEQAAKDGKAFCFFGPAWYYNFCMGPAFGEDAVKAGTDSVGDWGLCEGPQAFFWGGTWLLAATGSDNPTMLADVMDTFINDEEVCTNLIKNEAQFTNNQAVNNKFAADPEFGNPYLGGQNDTAIFAEGAKNIKFQNQTIYDQGCNEGLQNAFAEYLKGAVSKDEAMSNFYKALKEKYPAITVPEA
ncbi:MAG: carbohydrate ABC transporter substrate-binding protein [Oscillospiraceae bacterium]|nr:carbohydrate ABC transporter substrate-binding protein [Oscillospiraceae bacterium]